MVADGADDVARARADERLRTELVAWLTTVSPEGQPQTTPVWFWWDGESFHLFSRPNRPKLRNIDANPRVALHLEAGGTADEDVVIVEGEAALVPDSTTALDLPAYIDKYRSLIESYGWTPESFAGDYSVAFRIHVTRLREW